MLCNFFQVWNHDERLFLEKEKDYSFLSFGIRILSQRGSKSPSNKHVCEKISAIKPDECRSMNLRREGKKEKKKIANRTLYLSRLDAFETTFLDERIRAFRLRRTKVKRDNFWSREEKIHVEIFRGISLRQQRSQEGIRDEMVTTSSSKLVPFKINGKMLIANFPRTRSTYSSTTLESRKI